ncbi:LPS export ABC transporter periplasmic protein LptC [Thioalkalivibrio sp. ALJ16]|uniref:LPS export ABC transporter periplasmic protein LptC n=1 Tax=Thioalkalivibrio sp. ALJ16 TaxID=1158762 RepID=UPI0006856381|nr:LPS export ABC transporter periplasmic protein LptC [Thioalkalivibrio sp. ALJ16]
MSRGLRRPVLAALTTLAVLAAPAQAETEEAVARIEPPADTVTLQIDGFTLHATGADGEPTHRLRGSRLREFGRDGPQWIDDPELDLYAEGTIQWHWTAPAALHQPDAQTLDTVGPTRGRQPAHGERVETVIDSSDVRIATETMVATSEARSTLTQPGLFQRGTGLRVDSRADTIELFHDVYSLYSETSEEDRPHDVDPR